MGERGSSQHPCQCGLLGRTEPLCCDWSAASIFPCDCPCTHHVEAPGLGSLSTSLNATLGSQDLASSQCASLSHNNKDRDSAVSRDRLYYNSERTNQKGLVINKNIFTRFKDKRVWNLILMLTFVINKFRHWLPLTDNCHQKKTFKNYLHSIHPLMAASTFVLIKMSIKP